MNVGETERWLSLAGGGLLALLGVREGGLGGLVLLGMGGSLIYRGVTGNCQLYSALGINTAESCRAPSQKAGVTGYRGVRVDKSITVNRSPEEVYRAWRNFEGLPRFMKHLVSVKEQGSRSHWVARAPAGMTVEWDAEIIKDEPGRVISWRSLPGATVATAGSVHFTPASGGRGTEVHVELKYDPPGGQLGSWLAWAFGEEPNVQVEQDLGNFKQMAEGGSWSQGRSPQTQTAGR